MLKTAITSPDKNLYKECQTIAELYQLEFIEYDQTNLPPTFLLLDQEKLALINNDNKQSKPFYIDFCEGKMQFRRKSLSAKNDLLAKAIGIKKFDKPIVLDTTAGLGRDGFLLACMGARVTLLERNPVLYLLLADGFKRFAKAFPEINATLDYQLIFIDAKTYLKQAQEFQIIYLDPMFPLRTKSALVKKEMQILHELVGLADDTSELFELSLQHVSNRLVVKRPIHAKTITEMKPAFCYNGKTIRYDVYLKQN